MKVECSLLLRGPAAVFLHAEDDGGEERTCKRGKLEVSKKR